jgi:hypothetical protein
MEVNGGVAYEEEHNMYCSAITANVPRSRMKWVGYFKIHGTKYAHQNLFVKLLR